MLKVRDRCRGCHSKNMVLSLRLAEVPITSPNVGGRSNNSASLVSAPLDNYLCLDCGLNQLIHVVDPKILYDSYLYRTSISTGLSEHFETLCLRTIEVVQLKDDDFIFEFGSNDGTLLGHYQKRGINVIGMDPAKKIAEEATVRGIKTLPQFFNRKSAKNLEKLEGRPKLILANNVMANIDDLDEIFESIAALLNPEGAFVFETQYAYDVFSKHLIDVIYHEHLTIFSIKPLEIMLERFGLEIFNAERIGTKGGSMRFWIKFKNCRTYAVSQDVERLKLMETKSGIYEVAFHNTFSKLIEKTKHQIEEVVDSHRGLNKTIAAWGTSVGCLTLLHTFQLADKIDLFFDDAPFKEHLVGSTYKIPIFRGGEIKNVKPDLLIFLAWRYQDQIVDKHKLDAQKETQKMLIMPSFSIF